MAALRRQRKPNGPHLVHHRGSTPGLKHHQLLPARPAATKCLRQPGPKSRAPPPMERSKTLRSRATPIPEVYGYLHPLVIGALDRFEARSPSDLPGTDSATTCPPATARRGASDQKSTPYPSTPYPITAREARSSALKRPRSYATGEASILPRAQCPLLGKWPNPAS